MKKTILFLLFSIVSFSQTPQIITKELQLNVVNNGLNTDDILVRNSIDKRVKKISVSSLIIPQINSDWNAISGIMFIENKPRIKTDLLSINQNQNTYVGEGCLSLNVSGLQNTAVGSNSLRNNASGSGNSSFGATSLTNNINGLENTAIGHNSLNSNNGSFNTALGSASLNKNINGSLNVSIGHFSLFNNINGNFNTSIGTNNLLNNLGSNNISIGYNASYDIVNGNNNLIIGVKNFTGDVSDSIFIGNGAGVSRFEVNANGIYKLVSGAPIYNDNASALLGGMAVNQIYKTVDGTLKIVY